MKLGKHLCLVHQDLSLGAIYGSPGKNASCASMVHMRKWNDGFVLQSYIAIN